MNADRLRRGNGEYGSVHFIPWEKLAPFGAPAPSAFICAYLRLIVRVWVHGLAEAMGVPRTSVMRSWNSHSLVHSSFCSFWQIFTRMMFLPGFNSPVIRY